jgi:hypothetical protein
MPWVATLLRRGAIVQKWGCCGAGGLLAFYNGQRMHQTLQYGTPDEVYANASGLDCGQTPAAKKPAHKPKPEQLRPVASQTKRNLK